MIKSASREMNGQMMHIETGRIAKQASGSAVVTLGETVVLAAAIVGCALVALADVTRGPADRSWRDRVARIGLPAGAATLVSLILASPLLIGVARYFPFTVRASGFKAEAIVLWSLHPLLLAGAILPNAS